jgi:hypothetical protein
MPDRRRKAPKMIYKDAVMGARLSAMESPGVTVVIVHAPLETTEENGVFGYCPESAVSTLYRFGETVEGYRCTRSGVKKVKVKPRTSTKH